MLWELPYFLLVFSADWKGKDKQIQNPAIVWHLEVKEWIHSESQLLVCPWSHRRSMWDFSGFNGKGLWAIGDGRRKANWCFVGCSGLDLLRAADACAVGS